MPNSLSNDALLNDALLKAAGAGVRNVGGEVRGHITEIIVDATGKYVEYIILESRSFFGNESRFFAIAASPVYINITKKGNIVLQLSKDDIQFAREVLADKYPTPNLKFGRSIYELYNYSTSVDTPKDKSLTNQQK